MTISLTNYITTQTYHYSNNSNSISFITDLKNNFEYILKGNFSELWHVIVNSNSYELAYNFAVKNNMSDILNDFLSNLKDNCLIQTNIKLLPANHNYLTFKINKKGKNIDYYKRLKKDFIYKYNIIYTLCLVLNFSCNLNCKHCCSPKNKNNEYMSFEQAKKIIDEAYHLGVYEILLTGGECTINKDFLKIAKYIRTKHLKLTIFTNAQSLYDDNNLFNEIVNLYPSNIQISLYSLDSTIHDNMTRVKGSHKKAMKVIENLCKHNIKVTISNFQSAYNFGSYKDLNIFAKNNNIEYKDGCSFIYNPLNNNLSACINEEQMENYYSDTINFSLEYSFFEKNSNSLCAAGKTTLYINPNLDITPCIYMNYVFANYKDKNLNFVKNYILPDYNNKFIRNNLNECFKFDYCKYCFYCLTTSSLNRGLLKKDEILCANARAKQKAYLKHKQLQK